MNKYKLYKPRVNRDEVMRYLGYRQEIGLSADDSIVRLIDKIAVTVENAAKPAFTYKILDIKGRNESSVSLRGTDFVLTGRDISIIMENCVQCVLMAVTVGIGIDVMIRRAQVNDMTSAVILDSCAGSAVESVCNQLNSDIETELEQRGMFLTDRFSPGYGDLPLELQQDLCRLLDTEKHIGLTVGAGNLMVPTKSVTAVMGIADAPQKRIITGCADCRLKSVCAIRKAGNRCGRTVNGVLKQ